MDLVEKVYSWPFMNEPLYRWFLFFGAVLAIMTAWSGVLAFMQ